MNLNPNESGKIIFRLPTKYAESTVASCSNPKFWTVLLSPTFELRILDVKFAKS